MEDLEINLDELKLKNQKSILKQLGENEEVIASFSVFKYNEYKVRQERTLMVTNLAVYNLKHHSIKRKIDFCRIAGVTVACFGNEFVIHVPKEYDYRYLSLEQMDEILLVLAQQYFEVKQEKLPFYFKDEVSLVSFWTSKADSKKQLNMMPSDEPLLLSRKELADRMNLKKNQEQPSKTDSQSNLCFSHPISRTSSKEGSQTIWTHSSLRKEVSLQDFQLLMVLGGGAFGKVLLVEDIQTQEWFAMKVIKKQVIIENGKFEHTKTEKMVLEHVNFPFLASLVYAFQDSSHVFFVMRFLKGGELLQYLKRDKRFTESRTKFYIAQLVLALGHLHSKQIIYRDLKLENIIMDSAGYICLTDFGLAKKIMSQSQIATTFCGTAEYLSPEILKGDGQDYSGDWWALGIICYELLNGVTPFHNKNPRQMFELIKYSQFEFLSDVPISEAGKNFITRCLHKDKTLRLGANGQNEIQAHPWFDGVNWSSLLKKEIPAEFVPVTEGTSWIDNFDKDFTKLTVRITKTPSTDNTFDDVFKDF